MKAFLLKHKKLHLWLLVDLVLLAAYFLCRPNRKWMNALAAGVTGPLRKAIGSLCYLTEISIMEVLGVLLVVAGAAYLVWSVFWNSWDCLVKKAMLFVRMVRQCMICGI